MIVPKCLAPRSLCSFFMLCQIPGEMAVLSQQCYDEYGKRYCSLMTLGPVEGFKVSCVKLSRQHLQDNQLFSENGAGWGNILLFQKFKIQSNIKYYEIIKIMALKYMCNLDNFPQYFQTIIRNAVGEIITVRKRKHLPSTYLDQVLSLNLKSQQHFVGQHYPLYLLLMTEVIIDTLRYKDIAPSHIINK